MEYAVVTRAGDESPLVVFSLDDRHYGFLLHDVVEVVLMVALLPVPDAPPWLLGMADVRGRTVPVVDLRVRLGLPATPIGLTTPIVLVRREARVLGLVVDTVDDVLSPLPDTVEPPDELHSGGVVSGIARSEGRTIVVLDLAPFYESMEIESLA